MAGNNFAFLIFLISVFQVHSEDVPALLWRSSLEGAYPVSLTGHSLDADTFYKGYLQQLVDNPNTNVVVFMQDKLSIEDITRYADVFNENSEGAVYKNLQSFMEKYESTHVPNVRQPVDAVNKLRQNFKGNIINIDHPDDVTGLVLSPDAANLILVTLPKTSGHGKIEALVESDKLMGELTEVLAKSDRPFTAVYTGEQLSRVVHKDVFKGRQLLETAETVNYTLFNLSETGTADKSCFLMYFTGLQLDVVRFDEKKELPENTNGTFKLGNRGTVTNLDLGDATCGNSSAKFQFDYPAEDLPAGLTKFTMTFDLASHMRYWYIHNLNVTYQSDRTDLVIPETTVIMENNTNSIFGVIGFPGADGSSYHCGSPEPIKQLDRKSSTDNGITLTFTEWQLQLGVRNYTFARADDCIGFFSEAIWMGLIATLVLLLIVTFGVAMLSNINTMDRFDDPKGKSIQVNVAEN